MQLWVSIISFILAAMKENRTLHKKEEGLFLILVERCGDAKNRGFSWTFKNQYVKYLNIALLVYKGALVQHLRQTNLPGTTGCRVQSISTLWCSSLRIHCLRNIALCLCEHPLLISPAWCKVKLNELSAMSVLVDLSNHTGSKTTTKPHTIRHLFFILRHLPLKWIKEAESFPHRWALPQRVHTSSLSRNIWSFMPVRITAD